MFAFLLVDLLLVDLVLASNYANGWIPITRPLMFNPKSNRYMETRYASGWKPSHIESNSDYIKTDAILIITPKQAQTIQNNYNVHEEQALSKDIATTEYNNVLEQNDSVYSTKLPPEDMEENSLTDSTQKMTVLNPGDGLQKINVKIDINGRAPKQLFGPSSTKGFLLSDPNAPVPNFKKAAETNNSIIVKNLSQHSYEVTEPTILQELSHKTDDARNQYTNKLDHLLSKYNIKAQDMLKNYARSKLHQNKVIHMYRSPNLPVPFIPFRYNSLNHLPVDPLLAVFLSNYGYYLHGFYGLPNNYKNLYGYSASNNIHNNKPFGSYKIYSDTDSSN